MSEGIAPRFDDKQSAFKEFYSVNYAVLSAAEETIRNLLQLLLADIAIETPKLGSRVKSRDECIEKFVLKYRDQLERDAIDYKIQDYITDLIGVRIICLYETDIPLVERAIRDAFEVLSTTNKTKSLIEQVDAFGYKGLHLDVKLNGPRKELPEYKQFGEFRFEIQIRSIVQDAWSELDRKLKYKRQIPDVLKRRIVRLAALFELADQEFVAVRDETERLEAGASVATLVLGDDGFGELDSFSFLSLVKARYANFQFQPVKVDGFVDDIKKMSPHFKTEEFKAALEKYSNYISEFKEFKKEGNFHINPFTEMRHILYLENAESFDRMLYPRQREAFKSWMDAHPLTQ